MKVPPKRKGNPAISAACAEVRCLNESPSQKEGKYVWLGGLGGYSSGLNESPSQKEGKSAFFCGGGSADFVPQ